MPKKPLQKPLKELISMNAKIDMTTWTDDEWDAYVRADAERTKARMKAERDRLRQSN